jgi:type III pantothenate kinase
MRLLVDVGNTRIKWRMDGGASGALPHASEDLAHDLRGAWGALAPPRAVVLASVASETLNELVAAFVAHQWPGVPIIRLRSQRECCGVRVQYAQPEYFGIDRFAALIAAHALFNGVPVVVVDAGSALTVDALDATGLHLGGIIMPGLRMLASSLRRDIAQLGASAELTSCSSEINELQNETQAAIDTGVATMFVSGVFSALTMALHAGGEEAKIVLTGGDAAWLLSVNTPLCLGKRLHGAHLSTSLVLDGLSLLGGDEAVLYKL